MNFHPHPSFPIPLDGAFTIPSPTCMSSYCLWPLSLVGVSCPSIGWEIVCWTKVRQLISSNTTKLPTTTTNCQSSLREGWIHVCLSSIMTKYWGTQSEAGLVQIPTVSSWVQCQCYTQNTSFCHIAPCSPALSFFPSPLHNGVLNLGGNHTAVLSCEDSTITCPRHFFRLWVSTPTGSTQRTLYTMGNWGKKQKLSLYGLKIVIKLTKNKNKKRKHEALLILQPNPLSCWNWSPYVQNQLISAKTLTSVILICIAMWLTSYHNSFVPIRKAYHVQKTNRKSYWRNYLPEGCAYTWNSVYSDLEWNLGEYCLSVSDV